MKKVLVDANAARAHGIRKAVDMVAPERAAELEIVRHAYHVPELASRHRDLLIVCGELAEGITSSELALAAKEMHAARWDRSGRLWFLTYGPGLGQGSDIDGNVPSSPGDDTLSADLARNADTEFSPIVRVLFMDWSSMSLMDIQRLIPEFEAYG